MSRTIVRHLSQGTSAAKAKTELVFLHHGQPRTEFYAKPFLKNRAATYYYVPKVLQGAIPEGFLVNERIRKSVHKYGETLSLEEIVSGISTKIETALNSLIPESGPFHVSTIFGESDEAVSQSFEEIKSRRSDRLIFLPLYSHYWCGDSGALLNTIATKFTATTVPLVKAGREVPASRVFQNSDFSFDVSTVARWNDHPVVSDIWATKLKSSSRPFDGIVFAAPRKAGYNSTEYERSIWASCERTMQRLDHAYPWKLAFYNSWDSWNLPQKQSVQRAVRTLSGNEKTVAVVPISEVFPTFDTISILPELIGDSALFISPDENSEKLIQGLAELVKNHLLGRQHRQLEIKCDICYRSDCSDRDIFL